MKLLRIALAPTNPTVGAVHANVHALISHASILAAVGADVGVFPELAITGYPLEDLVQFPELVDAAWASLLHFAKATAEHSTVYALGLPVRFQGLNYNAAALVQAGRVLGVVPKERLPTYGVFYEGRTFAAGHAGLLGHIDDVPFGDLIFDIDGVKVAVEICEDLWSPEGPTRRRAYQGAELIINISASPYRIGISETRRELINTRSSDAQAIVVYCNIHGGNDGLVFDGGGYLSQNGRMLMHRSGASPVGAYQDTVDVDRTRRLRAEHSSFRADRDDVLARLQHRATLVPGNGAWNNKAEAKEAYASLAHFGHSTAEFDKLLDMLALGIADYYRKVGAFACIGVALSGGRDSLLCLWLARRALELMAKPGVVGAALQAEIKERLHAFYLPSEFSSEGTREAARLAAEEFGASFRVVAIDEGKSAAEEMAADMLGGPLPAPTLQNVQARVRGAAMWNWSNAARALFLQTSNMSEKAVGYTTIGGDMEGALSPIANLPKTLVNALLAHLAAKTGSAAIAATVAIPASAELAPGQEDEKDLMPYPVLDACLALLIGERLTEQDAVSVLLSMFPERAAEQLAADVRRFLKLFFPAIYKWAQSPLGIHVGNLDLDRERALQLPVVTRAEWMVRGTGGRQ